MAKTQKVSVALEKTALAAAKKLAAAEGTSLSGLLSKLLEDDLQRRARFDAMGRFLRTYAPDIRVSEEDLRAIDDEMNAPPKPVRRGRRKRAA